MMTMTCSTEAGDCHVKHAQIGFAVARRVPARDFLLSGNRLRSAVARA